MKRWMLLAIATISLTGIGQALPEDSGPNSPLWPSTWARYDTNLSARLEDGEWKILQEKQNEGDLALWKRFDLDKNGQVDDKEIADARVDYERWAKKSQSAYDHNHDGEVDHLEKIEWRRNCPY